MKNINTIVAPSILAADFGKISSEVDSAINKTNADWLHIDIMDGSFVPPITFGANMVETVKKQSDIFCDVHLMINNPENHIESFAKAGADLITIHIETCPQPEATIQLIKDHNCDVGLAVNPKTPIENIFEYLELIDLGLVMTVQPGWGGQKFIQDCIPKIKKLRAKCEELKINPHIEVDGGINNETGNLCREAGAHVLVAGSYIFNSSDRAEAINSLRKKP